MLIMFIIPPLTSFGVDRVSVAYLDFYLGFMVWWLFWLMDFMVWWLILAYGLFRLIWTLWTFLQILLCRSDSGIATCTVSECRWTSPPRFCHLGLAPLFYTKASWHLARLPGHEFGACALGCLLPARACSEPPRQDQTLFVYTLSISLLNLSLISKIL